MEFLIISGLSGAGKSRAADILEDLDFYCVDNMPVALLLRFAELCLATRGRYERVALVTDSRERDGFDQLFSSLDALDNLGCSHRILFLEANTDTLVHRYKESRRPHPLALDGGSIEAALQREKVLLAPLREIADYIIDTSRLTLGMLQQEIYSIFDADMAKKAFSVNVLSFGFKHGIPIEADLVMDVRFMPNPFYEKELHDLCGLDKPVSDFIFSHRESCEFLSKLEDMLKFLLPLYIEEGKHNLTIAIGCTGGQHRSVATAAALAGKISDMGYNVSCHHRELGQKQEQI